MSPVKYAPVEQKVKVGLKGQKFDSIIMENDVLEQNRLFPSGN